MQGTSRNVTAGWVRSQTPQTDVLSRTFICDFFSLKSFSWSNLCYSLSCFAVAFLSFNAKSKSRAGFPEHCHSCLQNLTDSPTHTISVPTIFLEALCPFTWQEGQGAAVRVKGLFLLHEKLLHLSILLPEYLTRVYEAWWGFDHPNSLRASSSVQHPCLLSRLSPHQYKGLSHTREENQALCKGSVGGTFPLSDAKTKT